MFSTGQGGKGVELEETLKAYFWQSGYFVIRGLPYRIDDEDITDIDLWLYERPAALTRRRTIVDIKNRRTPKAAERIVWARGLQEALGVDGAIVATTDKRVSVRRFARALGITLLDGEAISKVTNSEQLKAISFLRSDDLDAAIKRVDSGRHSSEFRQMLNDARGTLLTGMGTQSANAGLRAATYFARQAVAAQPLSLQAQVALRAFYITSAMAAISLDFLLADLAFRSTDERRKTIIEGVRFGQSDSIDAQGTIRAAIQLARQFADNGNAVAKQVEQGFYKAADQIHAEIIADHVVRIGSSEGLFNIARDIDRAGFAVALPSFDELSVECKSLLGAILDFSGVSREKIAEACPVGAIRKGEDSEVPVVPPGPLFDQSQTKR